MWNLTQIVGKNRCGFKYTYQSRVITQTYFNLTLLCIKSVLNATLFREPEQIAVRSKHARGLSTGTPAVGALTPIRGALTFPPPPIRGLTGSRPLENESSYRSNRSEPWQDARAPWNFHARKGLIYTFATIYIALISS